MTRKLVSLVLCAVLMCAAIPALAETVTVTDMMGREVTLEGPADRIVVMMPSDCEILFEIGAGDKVVGSGTYCNYPEIVSTIPEVNSGGETDLEQIAALQPQVVVMTKMAHSPELVETLESLGIAVIVTDAQTIDQTYDCITLLGEVTGQQGEAAAVIDFMKERFAAVEAKAKDTGMTVYFETTPLEYGYGLWSAGPGNFMDEIGTLCGLKNIFGDADSAWPMVSEEAVVAANPDVIITIDSNGMGDLNAAQVITAREGWQDLDAVKNGRVFVVGNDEFSRPGPRLANAAEALMELIESLAEEVPAA